LSLSGDVREGMWVQGKFCDSETAKTA
jgi:hypothetical protein